MKIIINHRQYSIIQEQSLELKGKTLAPKYGPPKDFGKSMPGGDVHTMNAVLEMVTAFIPVVGPFISAGIGLLDAKLYFDEGDKLGGYLALAFSLIPIVGIEVAKIPAVRRLGKRGMVSLAEKLKSKKPLNATETLAVNEIEQNSKLITEKLTEASKRLSGVASEVKTMRGPYIEKFGLDKYDEVLNQYITGKIDKTTFLNTLKGGTVAWGPWVEFAVKFGVKFKPFETAQIERLVKYIKSPEPLRINLDTFAGNGINYKIVKKWLKDLSPSELEDYKRALMSADPENLQITVYLDNVQDLSDNVLENALVHEIGHLKDPSLLRSPKYIQSFNKLFDIKNEYERYIAYVNHPWERIANTAMALNLFTKNVENAQKTMSKQQILNALDNIIQFTGGNTIDFSYDASMLLYGKNPSNFVVDFYQQMVKNPEWPKIMEKVRKQAVDMKSKIKIAM
jgi:hypothetical protein